MAGLSKWISKSDALIMLEMANLSLFCKSKDEIKKLIEHLSELIFSDCSISGMMETQHVSYNNLISTSINCGYPSAYLETYANNKYHFIDPLYKGFCKTLDVQNVNEIKRFRSGEAENAVLRLQADFGISNSFLYGLHDSTHKCSTIISIAGKQMENDQRTRTLIKYSMPYLALALNNLIQLHQKKDVDPLTPTEVEILKWLKEGKSSWDISMILDRSERVVNFHIGNIMKKLNASNRAHAVAIALEKKIIFI